MSPATLTRFLRQVAASSPIPALLPLDPSSLVGPPPPPFLSSEVYDTLLTTTIGAASWLRFYADTSHAVSVGLAVDLDLTLSSEEEALLTEHLTLWASAATSLIDPTPHLVVPTHLDSHLLSGLFPALALDLSSLDPALLPPRTTTGYLLPACLLPLLSSLARHPLLTTRAPLTLLPPDLLAPLSLWDTALGLWTPSFHPSPTNPLAFLSSALDAARLLH